MRLNTGIAAGGGGGANGSGGGFGTALRQRQGKLLQGSSSRTWVCVYDVLQQAPIATPNVSHHTKATEVL
jgi:hypothetical protein